MRTFPEGFECTPVFKPNWTLAEDSAGETTPLGARGKEGATKRAAEPEFAEELAGAGAERAGSLARPISSGEGPRE